ncbi:unnamed protein product [Paramecium sonneborni]|uniref:Uncharacterized protein n=1 Tax=Paramecium sonneborni TaxID=65129 RepID=A0A8S1M6E5_9CILI|nr:unnamed protein product [Paramecium sonneborni]
MMLISLNNFNNFDYQIFYAHRQILKFILEELNQVIYFTLLIYLLYNVKIIHQTYGNLFVVNLLNILTKLNYLQSIKLQTHINQKILISNLFQMIHFPLHLILIQLNLLMLLLLNMIFLMTKVYSLLEQNTVFLLDSIDVQQEYTELIEKSYVKLQLRKKPFKTKFQRQYQKLDELLSNIGDMVELGNKIYDFSNDDSDQKKIYQENLKILTETQNSGNIPQNSKLQQPNQNTIITDNEIHITDSQSQPFKQEIRLSTKLCCSSGLDYFQVQLQKMFEKKKPINLDCQIFLNFITCNNLFRDVPKVKLINKAYDQIIQQSDIYSILTRLNEIDKLKEILLTPKQLVMFNFTPKPLITLEEEDLKIDRNMVESQIKTPQDSKGDMLVYTRMMMKLKRKNKDEKNNHESIRIRKRASFMPQPLNNYAYDEIAKKKYESQFDTLNSQLIQMLGAELELIFQVCQKIDEDGKPQAKFHQKLGSTICQKKCLINQDFENQENST